MPSLVDLAASRIAEATAPQSQQTAVKWRWGTVEAVNADGTMDVDIAGSTVPGVTALHSATSAAVGDRVRVDYLGTDAVVTGVRATSTPPAAIIFRECATESTTIASGACVEVTAPITAVDGYTRVGVAQTWSTGTGNTIIGSQHCSGNNVVAKVRANTEATIVAHFLVMYVRS